MIDEVNDLMDEKTRSVLIGDINEYLGMGGLFNPELMEHDRVRDLLIRVREYLVRESFQK